MLGQGLASETEGPAKGNVVHSKSKSLDNRVILVISWTPGPYFGEKSVRK